MSKNYYTIEANWHCPCGKIHKLSRDFYTYQEVEDFLNKSEPLTKVKIKYCTEKIIKEEK